MACSMVRLLLSLALATLLGTALSLDLCALLHDEFPNGWCLVLSEIVNG